MLDTATASVRDQLLARVRPHTSFTDDFRKNISGAFAVLDRLEGEREKVLKDANLSEAGKRGAVAALVRDTLAPSLASGPARRAKRSGEHNQSRKAAIGAPTFDKSDLAAAQERTEVRNYLRSLSDEKRVQTAFVFATDQKLAQAVLSSPSIAMTGLSNDVFARVHQTYLANFHANELADVTALQGDIDALNAATSLVRTKLAGASGLSETEFNTFWSKLEEHKS